MRKGNVLKVQRGIRVKKRSNSRRRQNEHLYLTFSGNLTERFQRNTSSVFLARRKGKGLTIPKLIKDNFYRETQESIKPAGGLNNK